MAASASPVAKVDVWSPPDCAPRPVLMTFSAGPASTHWRGTTACSNVTGPVWLAETPTSFSGGSTVTPGRSRGTANRTWRPSATVAPMTIHCGVLGTGDPGTVTVQDHAVVADLRREHRAVQMAATGGQVRNAHGGEMLALYQRRQTLLSRPLRFPPERFGDRPPFAG